MADNKFEISGDIEHDDVPRRRSVMGRFFLFMVALLVILSVMLFPLFQEEFPALRRFTGMDKVLAPAVDTVLLNYLMTTADSLRRSNDSLRALVDVQALEQEGSDFNELVFEVQIGAFKHFDLDKYRENLVGLDGDQADGYAKLTLGKFFSPVAAKEFRDDMRKAGFKDAWVVAKRNGIRVEYDPATGKQIGE
jgi:hypothetical protein